MKKSCLVMIWLSLLVFLPAVLPAQQDDEQNLPEPELIEFLGTFTDQDSGWVDPQDLLTMDDKVLQAAEKQEDGDEK